jgi:hypothetical protein
MLVQAAPITNLRSDLIKVLQHQSGVKDYSTLLPPAATGTVITSALFDSCEAFVKTATTNRLLMDQSQSTTTTGVTSTRTTAWNSTITHTATVTFGSIDAAGYFFNAGGELLINPTMSGAVGVKSVAWQTMLSAVVAIRIKNSSNTGDTPGVGYINLTSNDIFIVGRPCASPFVANTYTIAVKKLGAVITITMTFADTITGTPDEVVSGTITNQVYCRHASGDNVVLAAPVIATTVALQTGGIIAGYSVIISNAVEGAYLPITISAYQGASTVYYSIIGVGTPGVQAADFTDGTLTGSFTISPTGDTNITTKLIATDISVDACSVQLLLYSDASRTDYLTISNTAVISDTTLGLSLSLKSGSTSTLNETTNKTAAFIVTGTALPATAIGTWTITGTGATHLILSTGNVNILSNNGEFSIEVKPDWLTNAIQLALSATVTVSGITSAPVLLTIADTSKPVVTYEPPLTAFTNSLVTYTITSAKPNSKYTFNGGTSLTLDGNGRGTGTFTSAIVGNHTSTVVFAEPPETQTHTTAFTAEVVEITITTTQPIDLVIGGSTAIKFNVTKLYHAITPIKCELLGTPTGVTIQSQVFTDINGDGSLLLSAANNVVLGSTFKVKFTHTTMSAVTVTSNDIRIIHAFPYTSTKNESIYIPNLATAVSIVARGGAGGGGDFGAPGGCAASIVAKQSLPADKHEVNTVIGTSGIGGGDATKWYRIPYAYAITNFTYKYGIWTGAYPGNGKTYTLSVSVYFPVTGTYTYEYSNDDGLAWSIGTISGTDNATNSNATQGTASIPEVGFLTVTLKITNGPDGPGYVGFRILKPDGSELWNTLYPLVGTGVYRGGAGGPDGAKVIANSGGGHGGGTSAVYSGTAALVVAGGGGGGGGSKTGTTGGTATTVSTTLPAVDGSPGFSGGGGGGSNGGVGGASASLGGSAGTLSYVESSNRGTTPTVQLRPNGGIGGRAGSATATTGGFPGVDGEVTIYVQPMAPQYPVAFLQPNGTEYQINADAPLKDGSDVVLSYTVTASTDPVNGDPVVTLPNMPVTGTSYTYPLVIYAPQQPVDPFPTIMSGSATLGYWIGMVGVKKLIMAPTDAPGPGDWTAAFIASRDYVAGGFKWKLPSYAELLIVVSKTTLTGTRYWSADIYKSDYAYDHYTSGSTDNYSRLTAPGGSARPVRLYTPPVSTAIPTVHPAFSITANNVFGVGVSIVAPLQTAKLVNGGTSVAISGDGNYLVIGAPDDNSVYIYKRTGDIWTVEQTITGTPSYKFGFSVDITETGDRIVVGAPDGPGTANHPGSGNAYEYARTNTTWALKSPNFVDPYSTGSADFYGNAVCINATGTVAIIGAYGDDSVSGTDNRSGYIYSYNRASNISNWSTAIQITPITRPVGSWYGWSVCVNKTGLVAATGGIVCPSTGYYASVTSTSTGVVTIASRTGITSAWNESQVFTPNPTQDGAFGTSVALNADGTLLVVGAPGETAFGLVKAGAVHVFAYTASKVSIQAMLTAPDAQAGALFGTSVDINAAGDCILVGAPNANVGIKTKAGIVYKFTKSGTNWSLVEIITPFDKTADALFGTSVSINNTGSIAVIGAPGAPGAPATYTFAINEPRSETKWVYFTANADWVVPTGATNITLWAIGGGGGTNAKIVPAEGNDVLGFYPGETGKSVINQPVTVGAGTTLNLTIGAGSSSTFGGAGGSSTVVKKTDNGVQTTLFTCLPGKTPTNAGVYQAGAVHSTVANSWIESNVAAPSTSYWYYAASSNYTTVTAPNNMPENANIPAVEKFGGSEQPGLVVISYTIVS